MLPVATLDDPRIAAYRNLRERTLRGEAVFVAEGLLVVERLLESPHPTESLLVVESMADEMARRCGGRAPLYVAPDRLLREIVGFNFHRGVLAVGRRRPPLSLEQLLARSAADDRPLRLLVGPELNQPENLGLIFRSAAGLGIDGVLLGPQSCDPLSRRTLRVSMGGVLYVPWIKSADLATDLRRLKQEWDVVRVATVLDREAEPLPGFRWPHRAALMLGNEYEGLGPCWLALADRRVTIPMSPGADSLNVGVAAGIFLYAMQCATTS